MPSLSRKGSLLSGQPPSAAEAPAPLTRKASGRVLGQAAQPPVASPTDALLSPVSRAIKRRVRKVPAAKAAPAAPPLPTILGSSSGVRAAVLARHGVAFTVAAADIDEKAIRHADPKVMTLLIARAKAQTLRGRLTAPCVLITADQIVLAPDGSVREKPESAAQAAAFIRSYAGATARTVSAVVVTNTLTGDVAEGVEVATVHFDAALDSPGEVEVALQAAAAVDPMTLPRSGGAAAAAASSAAAAAAPAVGHAIDVLHSAGALVIEHPALARHITLIEGSVDSVQGLPWALTASLIARVTAGSDGGASRRKASAADLSARGSSSPAAAAAPAQSRRRTRSSLGGGDALVVEAGGDPLVDLPPTRASEKRPRRSSGAAAATAGGRRGSSPGAHDKK